MSEPAYICVECAKSTSVQHAYVAVTQSDLAEHWRVRCEEALAEVRRLREELSDLRKTLALEKQDRANATAHLLSRAKQAEESVEVSRSAGVQKSTEITALRQSHARLLAELRLQRERWVLLKQVPEDPGDQAVCAIRNLDAAVAEAEALNGE